jgi:hypothetical protein
VQVFRKYLLLAQGCSRAFMQIRPFTLCFYHVTYATVLKFLLQALLEGTRCQCTNSNFNLAHQRGGRKSVVTTRENQYPGKWVSIAFRITDKLFFLMKQQVHYLKTVHIHMYF